MGIDQLERSGWIYKPTLLSFLILSEMFFNSKNKSSVVSTYRFYRLFNFLGKKNAAQTIFHILTFTFEIIASTQINKTYLHSTQVKLTSVSRCSGMRFGRRDPSAPFALARRLYHAAAVRVTGATCTSHTAHRLSHDSTPA